MIHKPTLRNLGCHAARVAVAALSCVMGLIVSASWKSFNRPQVAGVQLAAPLPQPEVQVANEPLKVQSPGAGGNGVTKGGVPFSFTSFTSADGVAYFQWCETHGSSHSAHEAFTRLFA